MSLLEGLSQKGQESGVSESERQNETLKVYTTVYLGSVLVLKIQMTVIII